VEGSALAGLEAGISLVDHVDASLAAHHTAFLVAFFGRFEGINDFHGSGFHLIHNRRLRNIRVGGDSVNRAGRGKAGTEQGKSQRKTGPFPECLKNDNRPMGK